MATPAQRLRIFMDLVREPPDSKLIPVEIVPIVTAMRATWTALSAARQKAILASVYLTGKTPKEIEAITAAWARPGGLAEGMVK